MSPLLAAVTAAAAVEPPDVDLAYEAREAAMLAVLAEECPPVTEDACFVCDEPLREVYVVPCVAGCCDRGLCLDCAESLGYPLH